MTLLSTRFPRIERLLIPAHVISDVRATCYPLSLTLSTKTITHIGAVSRGEGIIRRALFPLPDVMSF